MFYQFGELKVNFKIKTNQELNAVENQATKTVHGVEQVNLRRDLLTRRQRRSFAPF